MLPRRVANTAAILLLWSCLIHATLAESFDDCLASGTCAAHRTMVSARTVPDSTGVRPRMNWPSNSPHFFYYGDWSQDTVNYAINKANGFKMVVFHPFWEVTPAQVQTVRKGADGISGTADDILAIGYITLGQDERCKRMPIPLGDKQGPRVDPRANRNVDLSTVVNNPLGRPSNGGLGYASYYLDTTGAEDGLPDQTDGGNCQINMGAPSWYDDLKTFTLASDTIAGFDELLTKTWGKGFGADGLFFDLIDTAQPSSWGTDYEWTAPGVQAFFKRLSTAYPTKTIIANRGLFFYHPKYKHFPYAPTPYIDMVMFESYYTDSDPTHVTSPFFTSNLAQYAPKMQAESQRANGIVMLALGFTNDRQPMNVENDDYTQCNAVQGWPSQRTDQKIQRLNAGFKTWLASHPDTAAPVWASTSASVDTVPPPRVGIQEAVAGTNQVTVRWDVANDQTAPVRYNIYYSAGPSINFGTATKVTVLDPLMPANYKTGWTGASLPFEYTLLYLNGGQYTIAVRAEDNASPRHEDTNTVTKTVNVAGGVVTPPPSNPPPPPPPTVTPPPACQSSYRSIAVDGAFGDWSGVPLTPTGDDDFSNLYLANDVNYLYVRFSTITTFSPFSDTNTHIFIDADRNGATGLRPSGASSAFGSEFMIERGKGYDQRGGNWAAGSVTGLNWQLSPATGTTFEMRIRRAATYPDGDPILPGDGKCFSFMLQDNRGATITPAGITYTMAPMTGSCVGASGSMTIDGHFTDWSSAPTQYTKAGTGALPVEYTSVSIVNDDAYLYIRFTLYAAANAFTDTNMHIFIDTDGNAATGYKPTGASGFGSEFMIERGKGYDQRSGSFNAGSVGNLGWMLSGDSTSKQYELRIARTATYPGNTPLLPTTGACIRVMLQDNGGARSNSEGIAYRLV